MSTPWERVDAGRYAAQFHGHVIQAIRKDGKYQSDERPYIAVVDKIPLEPGEWSLNRAKTKAMNHVLQNLHKSKAEKHFNGSRLNGLDVGPPNSIIIPPAQDKALQAVQELEVDLLFEEPAPVPEPALVQAPPLGSGEARPIPVQTLNEPVRESITPTPGQFVITGMILADDLLGTLNAMKETLALIREHSDAECVINLPPVLKL